MANPANDHRSMDDATPTTTARLELDLKPQSEAASPAGALLTPDGARRAFVGWLQLASVIEDWRQTHEHENEAPDRRR